MGNTVTEPWDHPWFDVEIRSAILKEARDYWLAIRDSRKCPATSDFDLLDLPKVVSHLTLVDIFHDPMRYKFRMIGTFIADIAGRNSTGKWLDEELYPDNLEEMTWGFRYCAKRMEPMATEGPVDFANRDWNGAEALFLPLSKDGRQTDRVVCCYDLVERRPALIHDAGDVMLNWEK